jgi:hypothetical protein
MAGVLLTLLMACDSPRPQAAPAEEWFSDRTSSSGIDFVHRHCGTGAKYLVEINAGGVTLLDYDGDGNLDLFFPQGAPLPGYQESGEDLRDRLYRNEGGLRFSDVTEESGASEPGYSYSAAAADYDGDGDADLYLCNFGANVLLRNDSGRFVDVTAASGLGDERWSVAAAFLDIEQDGDLDVYVCNYIEDVLSRKGCRQGSSEEYRTYCNPDEFPAAEDQLFRNDAGRFVNITAEAGLAGADGSGLGVVAGDFDNDGDFDLFVSNDGRPNFLWRNDGRGKFSNAAWEAGVAVAGSGLSEACMGVDAADFDQDGDFDLLVTNLAQETNTLYRNRGGGSFEDFSIGSGLGPPSRPYVGFGCRFFDADNDADEDLMVVNGHVIDNPQLYDPAITFRQPPRFYLNEGGGRFADQGASAGSYFGRQLLGRGLATGDLDNDGDLDLVVAHNNGPPALLENRRGQDRNWIGCQLRGKAPNLQALGARVQLQFEGRTQIREIHGTSSYSAFQDLRVHFGLGSAAGIDRVIVRWPDGSNSEHRDLKAGRYHELRQADD